MLDIEVFDMHIIVFLERGNIDGYQLNEFHAGSGLHKCSSLIMMERTTLTMEKSFSIELCGIYMVTHRSFISGEDIDERKQIQVYSSQRRRAAVYKKTTLFWLQTSRTSKTSLRSRSS